MSFWKCKCDLCFGSRPRFRSQTVKMIAQGKEYTFHVCHVCALVFANLEILKNVEAKKDDEPI